MARRTFDVVDIAEILTHWYAGRSRNEISVRRWVRATLPEEVVRTKVRVLRPEPPRPGEEAQVDYGQLGRWVDPKTGKRHVVNAFAMVLPCSRHLFVYPVIKMDQQAWTQA